MIKMLKRAATAIGWWRPGRGGVGEVARPSRELVLKKLGDCFPDADMATDALTLLDQYGVQPWHGERERVQLAVLKQCKGSVKKLRHFVELANADYRDVLMGAEYPGELESQTLSTPTLDIADIRKADREQYDAWLRSAEG